jgi:hypothetical protein
MHDAGFAPGAERRMAKSARAESHVKQRHIREANRSPVSNTHDEQIVPPELVEVILAKVKIHVARGHWEQVQVVIDIEARNWELRRRERQAKPCEMLHKHARDIFDIRTANMIENVCSGTIGALLEVFPLAFIGQSMCGQGTIQKIAERLVKLGVLSAVEAGERVAEWGEAMEASK